MEQPNTGFQFSVSINQLAVIQGGFDIDVIDVGIIDAITHLLPFKGTKKEQIGEDTYFKLDWEKIPQRLPLFGLNSRSSVKSRIQKLVQRAFLVPKDNNINTRESWYTFGDNYYKFNNLKEAKLPSSKTDGEPSTKADANSPAKRTVKGGSPSSTVDDYERTSFEKTKVKEEDLPPKPAASSNSFSPPNTDEQKQALIKHLNSGIKNNILLAMCEGINMTLPEIREKFADYWIGLERTFTGSAADKRYVLNSLKQWAEAEAVNCRNAKNQDAPARFDSKLEKVIEIHHFYSHRIPSEDKKKAAQDLAKKLFKDGVTLEQIEFHMSKVPFMTSDWRHVDYFLSKFEKAVTIEPEDWKTEYRIGVGNLKPITRYQQQHGTA